MTDLFSEGHVAVVSHLLDELMASDPGDFAAVLAGLTKLRKRLYDR